jgi:EmrB/QacA subfamily drug resistance transporter
VPRGWGLPLAVVIVGMFMSVLDVSIVNVAIPRMQKEFGTATENIQWITTAYTLCLGVIVPTSAWLGERLGLRRLYLLSLVAFAFASALCGMAWDLNSMIIFRVLQAVPGGVIPVTCLTILYRMVPRRKLGTAMGMYGLGIVVAPGVGATLGGYLVDYVSWRLIFYINVPVGVLGAVAAMLVLPRFPRSSRHRFDVPGFLCIAAGLSALLLALTKAEDWGWTSYRTLMLICAGLLLLALFVVVELEVAQPLLDLRVFTSWPYVNSLLLIAVLSVGLFAVLFYVPLFLQEGQQVTAMNTGLTVLPQALVLMIMMPLAGGQHRQHVQHARPAGHGRARARRADRPGHLGAGSADGRSVGVGAVRGRANRHLYPGDGACEPLRCPLAGPAAGAPGPGAGLRRRVLRRGLVHTGRRRARAVPEVGRHCRRPRGR